MVILSERQTFLKNFFFDVANKYVTEEKKDLSWEHFWKNQAIFFYIKKTNEELFSFVDNKNQSNEDRSFALHNMKYPIMTEEENKFIDVIKEEYYKTYNIKKVLLSDKMPELVKFFNMHRGLDIEFMHQDNLYETLNSENAKLYDDGIHDFLNISQMDYLYLSQKGYYFK